MRVGICTKHIGFYISMLLVFSSCTHRRHLIKKYMCVQPTEPIKAAQCKQVEPIVTVWVHGTRFGLDPLYKKNFGGKPGLVHLHELPKQHQLTKRMKALADQCADYFPYETVYCFCWSGRLSSKEREWTAEILHQNLVDLIKQYQKEHGHVPAIRFVCHSHGGNVVLNLARVNADTETKIEIEELILFACPVQCENKDCAQNEMFKHIYSFYSPLDFVQILAPQWVCCVYNAQGEKINCKKRCFPLSGRRFEQAPHIHQAWIKMNGCAISHSDFSSCKFLRLLPELLDTMDQAYENHPELDGETYKLLIRIEK